MEDKKTEKHEKNSDIPHQELEKFFGIIENPELPETNNQENIELGKNNKKTS